MCSSNLTKGQHTTLGWAKVLSWSRSTRTRASSLFDAQGAALNDLTLKTFLGRIGLLSSHHLDKAKTTRLLGMRVKHDLALFNIAILFKVASHLGL